MHQQDTPTLCQWLGGIDALRRLTTRFYERVDGGGLPRMGLAAGGHQLPAGAQVDPDAPTYLG